MTYEKADEIATELAILMDIAGDNKIGNILKKAYYEVCIERNKLPNEQEEL